MRPGTLCAVAVLWKFTSAALAHGSTNPSRPMFAAAPAPSPLFDLKSTAWTLATLRLQSADVAAVAAALDARFGETPGLFDGEAVAILNHNKVMAYMVPARAYEAMIERLDDLALIDVIRDRADEKPVRVSLDDL